MRSRCSDRQMSITWPLQSENLTIRPAVPADAEAFLAYQRLAESQRYISRLITTMDESVALIEERTDDPNVLFCALERDGVVVGQIGGNRYRPEALGQAPDVWDFYLGYSVAPAYWGQGIASEAVRLFVPALHNDLGIRRILAKVFADNVASIRVLQKAGFSLEGTEHAAVWGREGHWLDDCTLAHLTTP